MNDDYKNLEDINMSFKLWNNSYYNVIFKKNNYLYKYIK